jgi:hypothetical protein
VVRRTVGSAREARAAASYKERRFLLHAQFQRSTFSFLVERIGSKQGVGDLPRSRAKLIIVEFSSGPEGQGAPESERELRRQGAACLIPAERR